MMRLLILFMIYNNYAPDKQQMKDDVLLFKDLIRTYRKEAIANQFVDEVREYLKKDKIARRRNPDYVEVDYVDVLCLLAAKVSGLKASYFRAQHDFGEEIELSEGRAYTYDNLAAARQRHAYALETVRAIKAAEAAAAGSACASSSAPASIVNALSERDINVMDVNDSATATASSTSTDSAACATADKPANVEEVV